MVRGRFLRVLKVQNVLHGLRDDAMTVPEATQTTSPSFGFWLMILPKKIRHMILRGIMFILRVDGCMLRACAVRGPLDVVRPRP